MVVHEPLVIASTSGLVEMQLTNLGRFELFRQESVGRRNGIPRVAHESCIIVAIHARGGVLKFTDVVDNDTAVHDVHTQLLSIPQS